MAGEKAGLTCDNIDKTYLDKRSQHMQQSPEQIREKQIAAEEAVKYIENGMVIGIGTGTTAFFFSSRRRHTRWTGDWSSDVCSSDLNRPPDEAGDAGDVDNGLVVEARHRHHAAFPTICAVWRKWSMSCFSRAIPKSRITCRRSLRVASSADSSRSVKVLGSSRDDSHLTR